ncbi:unnamed protein product [Diatraea saccharalis]|uniref:Cytochrome oxidase complex assembly protein 1 n=1 Tax=Diatraea saccharalis TaxID=40085 RepID=A0A9N9N2X1_9NEOP|nr:unnamed protein product [Diatraea saccharalis]
MTISTTTLLKIAAWGGIIVSSTGFYMQTVLIDRVRNFDYYKNALKALRTNAGAVYYLGEPIKDKRFKLTDTENNFSDGQTARFAIPVSGTKDRGKYYMWAERRENQWIITKAELALQSKPDTRLVVVKED